MTLTEFISVVSQKLPHLAWFIGAGASQSANVPSAADLMWDLKRRHYCQAENQTVAPNDLQNGAVREKITQYLISKGFPAPGDPSEYSRCFELVFEDQYDRQQQYIAAMLAEDRVSLTQGHRIFAALIASSSIKCIFTTNFDSVVEKALAEVAGQNIAAFHIEGSYAAKDAINADAFPLYCKLHGDFRYRSIKNLTTDLATQNAELSAALKIACNRFGLIVAGYSGRDDSVMALLNEVLEGQNPFPHGLYWLGLKGRPALPAVTQLLEKARQKGLTAELVEIETFDSVMARLWRQMPSPSASLAAKVGRGDQVKVSIQVPDTGTAGPIIRMNALPLKLPQTALTLSLKEVPDAEELERIEGASGGSISIIKGDGSVWAWGLETSLRKAFGANFEGVADSDISDRVGDLSHNLFLKPLIERTIALGLTRGRPLVARRWRDRMVLIVKDTYDGTGADALATAVKTVHGSPALKGTVPDLMTVPDEKHPEAEIVRWAEALEVELQEVDRNYWLLIKPLIWIWPSRARRDAVAFVDARSGRRYNGQTDVLMTAWDKFLLPGDTRGADHVIAPFGDTGALGAPRFTLNDRTAYSRRSVL